MVHVDTFILGHTNHEIALVVLNIDTHEIGWVLLTCDLCFYEIVTINGVLFNQLVFCVQGVQDLRTRDRCILSDCFFSLPAKKYTLGHVNQFYLRFSVDWDQMIALNPVNETDDLIFICETAPEDEFLKVLKLGELQNEVVSKDIIGEVDTDKRVPKEAQDLYQSINWA